IVGHVWCGRDGKWRGDEDDDALVQQRSWPAAPISQCMRDLRGGAPPPALERCVNLKDAELDLTLRWQEIRDGLNPCIWRSGAHVPPRARRRYLLRGRVV